MTFVRARVCVCVCVCVHYSYTYIRTYVPRSAVTAFSQSHTLLSQHHEHGQTCVHVRTYICTYVCTYIHTYVYKRRTGKPHTCIAVPSMAVTTAVPIRITCVCVRA